LTRLAVNLLTQNSSIAACCALKQIDTLDKIKTRIPKRYLVTAALPYANGPLHIGHIAGCYLPADIYVRFLKLAKEDVKFICGSDEHGIAITMRAKKEGITPQEVVDRYHTLMQSTFEKFGIEFDVYARTSDPLHHETAAAFFTTLYNKGVFEEKKSAQFYDESVHQFLADRYIKGECPKCGYTEAYGDQCEKCGSSLSPNELINPVSVLSGNKPGLKETTNWYLPLNHFEKDLKTYIESKQALWKPNVYGQCMSWINEGLHARAMTRDLDWGIQVPLKDAEGKVLYVWFDAPIGYISASKQLLPDTWEKYWKDPDTALVHFIGKDNIVFHCLIFPAMLKAHGEYILPEQVPANEFLNLEGNKLSTSRNWAVWLHEYLEDFPNREDELRYVLTSIAPETADSEFTWKDYQARVNNELVAILGNFVNRVTTLLHKYYEGKVPEDAIQEEEVIKEIDAAFYKTNEFTRNYRFRQGLTAIMDLARFGNKYLASNEPWKKINSDPDNVKIVLKHAAVIVANLGKLMSAYLPKTSHQLLDQLNIDPIESETWAPILSLSQDLQIKTPRLLFTKIEDEEITAQLEKLAKASAMNAEKTDNQAIQPLLPDVDFDTFKLTDLRTGVIIAAKKVPKTDKLLELQVDIGMETRTIVSGIAAHYQAEDLIGKTVLLIANLPPRKIKGIESKGMLLLADNGKILSLMSPLNDEIKGGAQIA